MKEKQKEKLNSLKTELREKGLLFPRFQELIALMRLKDSENINYKFGKKG